MSEHIPTETPTEATPPAATVETTLPDATAVTDPAALADHPAVEFRERSFTHESADHCEHETRGRVVVGVTDDDGSLLLCVRTDGDHVILPNDVVDDGEDRVEVARETVEDSLGVAVDLDGPVRVCRVDHFLDDGTDRHDEPDLRDRTKRDDETDRHDETDRDDTHLETTHHVVFRGSHPAEGDRDEPAIQCDDDWEAVWADGLPAGLDQPDGSVLDDVRLFLDGDDARTTATEHEATSDA